MALTKTQLREILSKAGVTAENAEAAVNSIMDGHLASVNALREERDRFKEEADKLPGVQAELDNLKGNGDAAKIQQAFDDYKAEVAAKEAKAAKEAVLRELAKDAGLSDAGIAKVIKYADWDKIELDKDGKAKDAKALIKSLKEEWPEYIQTDGAKGADVSNPPAGGGKTYKSKAEIMAIKDTSERQKAIAENINLFRGE